MPVKLFAVGLSNLVKSRIRPVLDKGLGRVFGRKLGETWFCSCRFLFVLFFFWCVDAIMSFVMKIAPEGEKECN